jgi:hypothetical protein
MELKKKKKGNFLILKIGMDPPPKKKNTSLFNE